MESGAANTIAETIRPQSGETRALLALAIANIYVSDRRRRLIDVAVITVAPIALSIARNAGPSKALFCWRWLGKAGNVMSPKPERYCRPDAFHVPLLPLLLCWRAWFRASLGLLSPHLLAKRLNIKGAGVADHEVTHHDDLPPDPVFWWRLRAAVAIFLLSPRPFAGISIDPLIALPVGDWSVRC